MAPTNIPALYRVFFTTIDPLIAASGVVATLFGADFYLKSFTPTPTLPPTPETKACLDIIASFLAGTTILQLYLLRARPADLTVWRAVQAFILVTDLGILLAMARSLSSASPPLEMMGQKLSSNSILGARIVEFGQILVTGAVALVRIAFLSGIGMSSGNSGTTSKRE